MMTDLGMQSPWVCYTNKIRELFKRDPDIKMTWSDATLELHMYVEGEKKAAALGKILPSSKKFGDRVEVKIIIHPANTLGKDCLCDGTAYDVRDAFKGNPIFSFARFIPDAFLSNGVYYIVFKKEVLQWFNDDLNDLYGNANMLAEDVARDVLESEPNVFYCTDIR